MTQRLLIRAGGPDHPGQLAALGAALMECQARLVDIHQHSALGHITFEMLVNSEVGANAFTSQLNEHLAAKGLAQRGLAVEVEAVAADRGQNLKAQAEMPRLIVSLMGPRLPTTMLAELGELAAAHGLSIEHMQRLSGVTSLEEETSFGACVECLLRGPAVALPDLRERALALGARHGVDIAIQEDSLWRRHRRLVCFDMDSTLIQAEVIDELARRHGVYDEVAAVTERSMRGELDFKQSFRERMAKLERLDESVLREIAENLPLMDGVERLMAHLKRLGYRTAIISGGFTYFARYLQARLGFDEIHANELVIHEGKITGEVREPIIDADRKAWLLGEIARREGWDMAQTVAVGDGANDLKMLESAGLGIAFRAKPLVRQQARQSISTLGLDAVLYLLGYHEDELARLL
ncbi:phosphoserine phosphatase [Chromohalobacter marismortui]|uniref:Phosphoserine phosphatase n=1 Tax=Chromohalobacter marismortui TaxID=42055 RepID=A0A4R7NIJ6_9GAMM|nr:MULTISPECIES: phosphoserine phosphatase SerB [Chromohalobacter]MCI0511513.1 phosphoserine phosphatase SerB [Chromohalobacter sp.]MCI0594438.1 phosphoserine phosphatase SerB [Chromohalobacter sp.]TDU20454.1 phosphoserine phosphatase [Chromohalobacter marismortui]